MLYGTLSFGDGRKLQCKRFDLFLPSSVVLSTAHVPELYRSVPVVPVHAIEMGSADLEVL